MVPLQFLATHRNAPLPRKFHFLEPVLHPLVRQRFSPEEHRALDGLVSAMKLGASLTASGVDPQERMLVALTRKFDAFKFEAWCDRVASGKKPRAGKRKAGAPDTPEVSLLVRLSHIALSAAAALPQEIIDELDDDYFNPEVEKDDARDRQRVRLAHAVSVFCHTVDAPLDLPDEYEWQTINYASKRHELTWAPEERHPHFTALQVAKRERLGLVSDAAQRVLAATYLPKPPPLCPHPSPPEA